MNYASPPAVGELHPDLPGWTEQLAIAMAAARNPHELRINQGDRIAVEVSRERPYGRWAKLLILLAASSSVAAAGLLGANRFLKTASVSSPPPGESPGAPASVSNSNEGYRITIKPTVVRAADRAPPAPVLPDPKPAAPARIVHPKPAHAVVRPAPSARNYAPPAPSPAAGAAEPPMQTRLTPVPETRPTTIDGWMLREVVNGTAVLEGPDGIRRVRRGDTVPGVGRVIAIFGWGNRLIVATSRGLISTR